MWANAQRDGTLCSVPQSLADDAAGVPWSNAANIEERKTWTQSEFAAVNVYIVYIYTVSGKKWNQSIFASNFAKC